MSKEDWSDSDVGPMGKGFNKLPLFQESFDIEINNIPISVKQRSVTFRNIGTVKKVSINVLTIVVSKI